MKTDAGIIQQKEDIMFEEKIEKMNQNFCSATENINFDKRVYTVDEIQDILGVGRNTAYELVKSRQFKTVKVGGQYRISKKSFDTWLDGGVLDE